MTFKQLFTVFGLLVASVGMVIPVLAADANPNFLERSISGAHAGRTLNQLQNAIEQEGFSFMRVQNVDEGLAGSGFERPPYKIVFFGNREKFVRAREIDPRVTPYLPLKITVYEDDKGNTHLSVVDPAVVGRMFNPRLKDQFEAWSKALKRILDRTTKEVRAETWRGD
ncbi:DUF302 domain-containing protein [Thiohalorhabdus sp.]|uniref:DUF302 domain-containing protein n=1 Tax=Thiohalorhabdus sp. TaxID=3094134 RepID=UPI002FC2A05E